MEVEGRSLKLTVNQPALDEVARLDGCYVLKTDLPESAASKQVIHDRYKDLAEVEQAFRTCKTAHLETRPIYVRTEDHTRGHVLVVMLAYLIRPDLSQAWSSLDVTVEEGLNQLQTLCSTEMIVEGGASCLKDSGAERGLQRVAPSAGYSNAGSVASYRDPCSHAEKAGRSPQSPLECGPFLSMLTTSQG